MTSQSGAGDTAFAAYGQRWVAYIQRPWGFAVDRACVRWTGFSFLLYINCKQGRRPYTPVLLLTTIGSKTGRLRTKALPT